MQYRQYNSGLENTNKRRFERDLIARIASGKNGAPRGVDREDIIRAIHARCHAGIAAASPQPPAPARIPATSHDSARPFCECSLLLTRRQAHHSPYPAPSTEPAMPAAETVAERVARSLNRLDGVTGVMAEREARRLRDERRADAAEQEDREAARRAQLRRWADRCREHQKRYDSVFGLLGKQAPKPAADAFPPDYRRDLFGIGQSMLPPEHDLANGLDPRDLDNSTIIPFEQQLLDALSGEAEVPSEGNLPEDGSMVARHRADAMGVKSMSYYGRQSFIKDFSRAPLKVLRFIGPGRQVIYGPAFPTKPD
jgi:hypothetical protein